jgi:hypothetical protein
MIPLECQPAFPGDRALECRIKSIIRWNAMAMVVEANKQSPGTGGHISTYASLATLFEVDAAHIAVAVLHAFARGGSSPSPTSSAPLTNSVSTWTAPIRFGSDPAAVGRSSDHG